MSAEEYRPQIDKILVTVADQEFKIDWAYREIAKLMESYHQSQLKEKIPSEEEKIVIGKYILSSHIPYKGHSENEIWFSKLGGEGTTINLDQLFNEKM